MPSPIVRAGYAMCQSTRSAGFTLIELMIVVAIIAILAAIALPAYQDYVIRSQVSEGLVLADGARLEVWNFYAQRGTLPADNTSANLPSPASITGKFVGSVTVTNGIINVAYTGARVNQAIFNGQLGLTPSVTGANTSLIWTCAAVSGISPRYLPTTCRSGSN